MDDAAHRFHGTVGKRIANILTECGREGTRSMWEAAYERLGPLVHNDWSREMIVLVCLGDILVRRAAFFMGETIPWDDVLWEAECLCRWLRTSTIPEGDYYADQFFYRDLAGWIKKNYAAFTTSEADVVDIERTPGYFTNGRRKSLVVPRSTLESLIPDQYDPIRTLYRLGDIRTISESPRPSFDNSTDRDPGNDWMRIDVEAVC